MFTKQYWNDRVLKHGHTGHAEPFYYCFDQEARKFAVSELVGSLPFRQKENALDFGCGSGDFLKLLTQDFKSVKGYDFSERIIEKTKQRYSSDKNISLSDNFKEIKAAAPYDLVLSVTVLQNLNSEELKNTLTMLAGNLDKNGFIICLEFFTSMEMNLKHNTDKAVTEDWFESIRQSGLILKASHHFYNPVVFPSASWKMYNRDLFLKFLKPFKGFQFVQKIMAEKARQIIYRERDILHDQNSIFKIYILQK